MERSSSAASSAHSTAFQQKVAPSRKPPGCCQARTVTGGRNFYRMAGGSCSSPWDRLTFVVCISAPRTARKCNGYRIENQATGSCRLLTCCSRGWRVVGTSTAAAIPQLSRESWYLLPRRFSCHRGFFGYSAFSSSTTGSIAYRTSAGETQLVWLDRTGRSVGTVGQADDSQLTLYQLSRDGRVAAVTRTIAGNTNVWLLDTERGVPRRLSFDVNDNDVILSPDGTRVAHQAKGPRDGSVVYERRSDGTGGEIHAARGIGQRMAPPPGLVCRRTFHRVCRHNDDGLWICGLCPSPANASRSTSRGRRLWKSTPGSRRTAAGSLTSRLRRDRAKSTFSLSPAPDRRSGVRGWGCAAAMATRRRRAVLPRARQAPDGCASAQRSSSLETGPPRALFTLATTSSYEPSPDGQRFLVTAIVSAASPITVVLNWKPPAN